MANPLSDVLQNPGPHTAESVAARLPGYPPEVIREALEVLVSQGVLVREADAAGAVQYRYVAPDRYQQANLDVVRDPGTGIKRRPR